ncbi:hypothetical protein DB30_00931 [Enhygromyxa salina]|uniref:Uncharacterized protein n=1 Tax=Enhygromyxa salina TaxID=215803 RepID=A0A0C1Z5I3_9BACT|nr:hypothetical protein DB30_00931 [Enhygromyxa salina]
MSLLLPPLELVPTLGHAALALPSDVRHQHVQRIRDRIPSRT